MELEQVQSSLHQAESAIERAARNAFVEWGAQLKYIRDNRLYVAFSQGCTWEQYTQERWEMSRQRAEQLIEAHEIAQQIATFVAKSATNVALPMREGHVRPLASLPDAKQRAEVWQHIIETTKGNGITAKIVHAEVEKYKAAVAKTYITLDEWENGNRWNGPEGETKFNAQDDPNIEWAAWSWNPVTGCLHECPYCYAVDIANRFYPHKFQPTFHPQRLNSPKHTTIGSPRWDDDIGYKSVFVCSMADLFGEWVPKEWIDQIMDVVRENQQWNFIFLTKNPSRYASIEWPSNTWVGATIDRESRVEDTIESFEELLKLKHRPGKTFISFEPLLERIDFSREELGIFDWVIVGGQSKTSLCQASQPDWEWVENIFYCARTSGCRVYFKHNLTVRPREYPS